MCLSVYPRVHVLVFADRPGLESKVTAMMLEPPFRQNISGVSPELFACESTNLVLTFKN